MRIICIGSDSGWGRQMPSRIDEGKIVSLPHHTAIYWHPLQGFSDYELLMDSKNKNEENPKYSDAQWNEILHHPDKPDWHT